MTSIEVAVMLALKASSSQQCFVATAEGAVLEVGHWNARHVGRKSAGRGWQERQLVGSSDDAASLEVKVAATFSVRKRPGMWRLGRSTMQDGHGHGDRDPDAL